MQDVLRHRLDTLHALRAELWSERNERLDECRRRMRELQAQLAAMRGDVAARLHQSQEESRAALARALAVLQPSSSRSDR
ncbi:MAG: hypothetical protein M3680_04855 [Myxococcota bacterium]|nr:hypothetical protein [Myxococcota bacterium]